MKISFCITCKNRLHQLSQTLLKNLQDNQADQADVEFILVDFASRDGLKEWVIQNCAYALSTGYLKYYYTSQMDSWECPLAKNTAHWLGTGDILVNLDCDNFTGKNGARYVMDQFELYGPELILHQSSSQPGDGSFGRISLRREYFHLIGGYNESFNPMGYQDTDLILRSVSLGLIYIPKCDSIYNQAIPNTKDESILYTNTSKNYLLMCIENKSISDESIYTGQICVNQNGWGIRDGLARFSADVNGAFNDINYSCFQEKKETDNITIKINKLFN